MSTYTRICLFFVLSTLVTVAYSPSVHAEKKDRSNSNSDDKKDDDQNDQQKQKSNSQPSQKSNSQQFQYVPQNSQNKQFKFDKSQQSQNNFQNNFQNNQQFQKNQKQPPWNGQKQGSSQQNINSQKNIQLQGVQNKPDWISKSHNDHKDVKNFVVKFGGPEPFSNKWYNDHPKAWHYHHDHDDAWKVVTAAGVLGFLGWEVYHPRTVVVYEPLPYDTLFYSRPGVIIDPSRGNWMPLGQFALMLGPGDNSTRMLDLAIDNFGHIRGSYCDMISGASYNVAGIVDQRSQYAQWSLESNRGLTFYTPLGEMMQPQGAVYVQLPSGERQQWQLVRMDGGN